MVYPKSRIGIRCTGQNRGAAPAMNGALARAAMNRGVAAFCDALGARVRELGAQAAATRCVINCRKTVQDH